MVSRDFFAIELCAVLGYIWWVEAEEDLRGVRPAINECLFLHNTESRRLNDLEWNEAGSIFHVDAKILQVL